MVRDYGKLLGLVVALVVVGLLVGLGRIDPVAGAGLIGTIIGYLTGNGQNAVTGKAPSPVMVPSDAKVVQMAAEAVVQAAAEAEAAEAEAQHKADEA